MTSPAWPALPLADWQQTKDTLQLYMQVAGKIRLALAPPEPQWAHVTSYLTARGLTTGPMPYREKTIQIDFDFIAHAFIIQVSDGRTRSIALAPRTVADFYGDVFALLDELGIFVDISAVPQEVPNPIAFDKDTIHASYDRDAAHRFWQILSTVDVVLKQHRAPFKGRHTPVQFFWGGFDLAYTRYGGRPATPPPGSNRMMRLSMDAEELYSGFWPGDARLPEPAFGVYIYPKPDGVEALKIAPSAASWNGSIGLFVLRYEDVRTSDAPADMLLEFLASTYRGCAGLAGWDSALLG